MDFIHRLHYGKLLLVPFKGDSGLYWFAPVRSEKLNFYALSGKMG